jgi:hypothetical protein
MMAVNTIATKLSAPSDPVAPSGPRLSDALFRRKPKNPTSSARRSKSSSKKSKPSGEVRNAEPPQPADGAVDEVLDDLLEQLDVNSEPQVVAQVTEDLLGSKDLTPAPSGSSSAKSASSMGSSTLLDKMDDVREKFWAAATHPRKSRQQARRVGFHIIQFVFLMVGFAKRENARRKRKRPQTTPVGLRQRMN